MQLTRFSKPSNSLHELKSPLHLLQLCSMISSMRKNYFDIKNNEKYTGSLRVAVDKHFQALKQPSGDPTLNLFPSMTLNQPFNWPN